MSTGPDEIMRHKDQGRVASFQVGRQQSDDTPLVHRAIKSLECGGKAATVEVEVFYFMAAADQTGSAAALECDLRSEMGSPDGMGFEETNREKGNGFRGRHGVRIDSQGLYVLAVKSISGVLETKNVQGTGGKRPFGQREQFTRAGWAERR